MPNKISQFWQELKRRKVTRTTTVYAAAAFVILELVSIIEEPLKLPEWTLPFMIVLLCVGFIISIILSWIYDIHPGEGVVKTEPAHKVKAEDIPKSSNSWKIASYISFVVIAGLIVLNAIPRKKDIMEEKTLDKSIAVLPFESLSDDPEKQYLADGVMEDILLHLAKIKDLRVMSSTSVQKYRKTDKSATEICNELGVSYILAGRFQKYGDQARLIVQLIQSGIEEHAWANDYNRDWSDIFQVQSEVAHAIARELHAVISPEVKQSIEKIPTSSLVAYDLYQQGRQELWKLKITEHRGASTSALDEAENLFNQVLQHDPQYAEAYAALAQVYLNKHIISGGLSEDVRDSILLFADKALLYDQRSSSAHVAKGRYYFEIGNMEQGLHEFEQAIELNPNNYNAYYTLGDFLLRFDHAKSIFNLHKAASISSGAELVIVLNRLSETYTYAGFLEEGEHYAEEAFRLSGDTISYLGKLSIIDYHLRNYDKAVERYKKCYAINPEDNSILRSIATALTFTDQFEESLEYFERFLERGELTSWSDYTSRHRLAAVLFQNNQKEEAEKYLFEQIAFCEELLEEETYRASFVGVFYDMAGCYALLGEKEKAFEYLRLTTEEHREKWLAILNYLQDDSLLDKIRDDPEFQRIAEDYEALWQKRHEEIRQWLVENDIL
jgi:TolB-like protein/Tfp pilus assembly protein PilF